MTWSDTSGNLWLFGGGVAQGPALVSANDLWRYKPGDRTWTWVSGSQPGYTNGVYGTRGTAAATNVPGARRGAAKWTDSQGRLWLFGGDGMSETSAGLLSDLWMFDPVTLNWTWVVGSKSENRVGAYGDRGKSSPKSEPGGRIAASTWVDNQGRFWLFGGGGCSATSCDSLTLNDLWSSSGERERRSDFIEVPDADSELHVFAKASLLVPTLPIEQFRSRPAGIPQHDYRPSENIQCSPSSNAIRSQRRIESG